MGVPLSLTTRYSLRKNNRTLNYVNLRLQGYYNKGTVACQSFVLVQYISDTLPPLFSLRIELG
jgi:hypothetical protein